jgi:phosphohistidine swiveling domain-containing protein
VSLDDRDALDVARVGAKAARLAEARQRHFGVLPGLIVTVEASGPGIRAGQAALRERGIAAARAAVSAAGLDPGLLEDLAGAADLGPRLVVRSSTELDGDGAWSGAFASFEDIAPDEVATAVRGCWASLFAPDALARFEQEVRAPGSAGMAVLVQPQLTPAAGGWTRVTEDSVEVVATLGSPSPLLAGWVRGARYLVASDGDIRGGTPPGPLDLVNLRALADTARRARDELAADRMEWALAGGEIFILQLDRAPARITGRPLAPRTADTFSGPPYRRLARVLVGRSGQLADRFIVPWGLAAPDSYAVTQSTGSPSSLFQDAKRLATHLGESVAFAVRLTPQELLDRLDVADPELADRFRDVRVDPESMSLLLGAMEGVGNALAARGLLDSAEELWWQSVEWVERALTSDSPGPRSRWLGDRWARLLFGVISQCGLAESGTPASDGRAAGRATFLSEPADVARFRNRDVLVVERPLPAFAPLLWKAAALVSRTGGPAAHLCEVARSLAVPAVVSADIELPGDETVAAVDGLSGEIFLWSERSYARGLP